MSAGSRALAAQLLNSHMNKQTQSRIGEFNERLHEAQNLLSIARDRSLQRAMVDGLRKYAVEVGEWKKAEVVAHIDEESANIFLGMECVLAAISAELEMWILLKDEQPERAWEKLVAAQTATTHAVRAHDLFSSFQAHAQRLLEVETLIFPPQVFLSAGLVVRHQICTICDQEYGTCDHLVGMPYWGEFCFRRLTEVEPDHVAIVAAPANKLCRVTHISVEGGKRNRMTWVIEPDVANGPPSAEAGGLVVSGSIISAADLEQS